MSVSLMYLIAELTVAASLAIFVVGLTRKPLRRFAVWISVRPSVVPVQSSALGGTALAQRMLQTWRGERQDSPNRRAHVIAATGSSR